jgi:hypothetical protein
LGMSIAALGMFAMVFIEQIALVGRLAAISMQGLQELARVVVTCRCSLDVVESSLHLHLTCSREHKRRIHREATSRSGRVMVQNEHVCPKSSH